MGRESIWQRVPEVGPSQFSKQCQLSLGFAFGGVLGGVLDGVNMYLGSIILIKTYSALFTAIGGRDGMDAGGTHWMTCSINRTRQALAPAHARIFYWACWASFHSEKHVYN
jgi:hypothetical protein